MKRFEVVAEEGFFVGTPVKKRENNWPVILRKFNVFGQF